jgi:hypothetical protein
VNRWQSKAGTDGAQVTDFAEQREDLLQSIERHQEDVRVAVHELAGAARSKLNASAHIKEFPLTWTVGAFVVGVWLGSRGAPASATVQLNGARQRRSR